MGGPQCRVLNLRNGHVSCHLTIHVTTKMLLCPMMNIRNALYRITIFLVMSLSPMSHVDFKKRLCHCVEFRGQGPY